MTALDLLTRLTIGARKVTSRIENIRCSFCGRGHAQVRRMLSGPGVYICDACVQQAARIIAESDEPNPA